MGNGNKPRLLAAAFGAPTLIWVSDRRTEKIIFFLFMHCIASHLHLHLHELLRRASYSIGCLLRMLERNPASTQEVHLLTVPTHGIALGWSKYSFWSFVREIEIGRGELSMPKIHYCHVNNGSNRSLGWPDWAQMSIIRNRSTNRFSLASAYLIHGYGVRT